KVRYFESRRRLPCHRRQQIQQSLECHVAMTKDVALACLSVLPCEQMTSRNVAHIDNIQSCINVKRHSSFKKSDNHFACWRGLYVIRADWRRRIDDHHIETAISGSFCFALSQEF